MQTQSLSDLIERIYATTGETAAWAPLLDRMCEHLGITSACAQLLAEEDRRLHQVWHTRDTGSIAFAAQHDRWVNNPDNPRLHMRPSGQPRPIGSDRRLFADAPDLMRRLNEGLARAGLGQAFWVGFPVARGQHFSLIFHRRAGDLRDLSQEEEALLLQLLPHFRQSAAIGQRIGRLTGQNERFGSLIDDSGLAMVVCDQRGRVEWRNTAAGALLQSRAALHIVHDMLHCRSGGDQRRLLAALKLVADGDLESSVAAIGVASDAPLHLRVRPVDAGTHRGPARALALTITRPDATIMVDPDDVASTLR